MNQRNVPCYVIEAIKDEPALIDTPGPVDREYISRLLGSCPFVFAVSPNGYDIALPFTDDSYDVEPSWPPIGQISPLHQRSFEVKDQELPSVWHDEFGHVYTSLSLKGNNFSDTRLINTATAPNGFIAYGLQESNIIERVLVGSRVLRSAGISTEWILGLSEPTTYGVALEQGGETDWHDFCSLQEYKQQLAQKAWSELKEEEKTIERYLEYQTKMQRLTYYVSARAMDTSIRIRELKDSTLRKEAFETYTNMNPTDKCFDYRDEEDLLRFLESVTLPKAATNMRKAHDLGVAFRFPNDLNTTVFGSIVDLDSLHGEPLGLGDDEITIKDKLADIVCLLKGVAGTVENQHVLDIKNVSLTPSQKEQRMAEVFLRQYFSDHNSDYELSLYQQLLKGDVVEVENKIVKDFLENNLVAAGVVVSQTTDKPPLDTSQPLPIQEVLQSLNDTDSKKNEQLYKSVIDITYFHSIALNGCMKKAVQASSASSVQILLNSQNDFWKENEPAKLLEYFGLLQISRYTGTAVSLSSLDKAAAYYQDILLVGHAVVQKLVAENNVEWLNIFHIEPASFSVFDNSKPLDNGKVTLNRELIDTTEGRGIYAIENVSAENLRNVLFNNHGSIECLTIKNSTLILEQDIYANEQVALLSTTTKGGYLSEFITDGNISLSMASTDDGAPTYEFCLNNEANYIASIEITTTGRLVVTILILNGVLPEDHVNTSSQDILKDIFLITTLAQTRRVPKKSYPPHLLYRQLELFRDVTEEPVNYLGFLVTNNY